MAKITIKKASTDVTLYVFIQASNVTTGAGLTGLTFETASLVASYVRPGAARAALTLATQTVTGAHSDGGFVEIDSTNMPGVYRLDLSDAVCATGVPSVVVMLKGAANMSPLLLEIQLTDFDLNDASPNVTVADIANDAITAAAYDESTAFPVKSADTGATAIARVGADSDTLETLSDQMDAIKTETASILEDTGTTLDTKINTIDDFLDTEVAAILADTNELQTDLVNGGRLDLLIDAIKAKTDNLPADPADDSDIDAQLAAIKAETALIVEDTGTTIPATLATIEGKIDTADTVVDAIKAKTDNLPADPADDSDIDTAIAAVKTVVDAILVDTGTTLDANITAILADTDELQAELADGGRTDLLIDAILEDTGTTIPGMITTIDNEVAVIDGIVDAILADTNELQTDLTDGGRLDLLIDTGSSLTAADIWSYTPRTLTNAGVNVNVPATGDPIYLYRDTTNIVSFTNLGVVSGYTEADDKAWFSIKDNLDDTDASAIVHVSTTSPGDSGAASSLLYINGSAPVAATDGSFLFTDYTAGNATLTLKPAASDDLPVYSVTPLYWDIKVYDKSTDTITILQQGTAYILATATRTTS